MTGLMLAILFFSSLSIVFTTQPITQNQIETEQTTSPEPDPPQTTQEQIETEQPSVTESDPTQTTQEQTDNSTETTQTQEPNNTTEFERGTINTVGVSVYSDRDLTEPLSSINWGTLKPGTKSNIKCYVQNTGQSTVILRLETSNWTPSKATAYLTLTWNYEGQELDANQATAIILTLAISENIQEITSFNFDITIVGN